MAILAHQETLSSGRVGMYVFIKYEPVFVCVLQCICVHVPVYVVTVLTLTVVDLDMFNGRLLRVPPLILTYK
jgi:hypothetical protein